MCGVGGGFAADRYSKKTSRRKGVLSIVTIMNTKTVSGFPQVLRFSCDFALNSSTFKFKFNRSQTDKVLTLNLIS